MPESEDQDSRIGDNFGSDQGSLDKLNARKYDVKPATIYKQLFGREAEVDERTGELVSRPAGAAVKPTA